MRSREACRLAAYLMRRGGERVGALGGGSISSVDRMVSQIQNRIETATSSRVVESLLKGYKIEG